MSMNIGKWIYVPGSGAQFTINKSGSYFYSFTRDMQVIHQTILQYSRLHQMILECVTSDKWSLKKN